MSPTSWHKSQRKFRSPHQCGKVNDGADEVLTILVTLDYFIVLGSSKSKHIAISTLASYLDVL
jgi:hypothetical protein